MIIILLISIIINMDMIMIILIPILVLNTSVNTSDTKVTNITLTLYKIIGKTLEQHNGQILRLKATWKITVK